MRTTRHPYLAMPIHHGCLIGVLGEVGMTKVNQDSLRHLNQTCCYQITVTWIRDTKELCFFAHETEGYTPRQGLASHTHE